MSESCNRTKIRRGTKKHCGIEMTDFVRVENDGPRLLASNYWETEQAAAGYWFASINAGAIRLLMPAAQGLNLPEMQTGRRVILARGAIPIIDRQDAMELTFDDGSANPYRLFLCLEQFDRLPGVEDDGRQDLELIIYEAGPREVLRLSR